MLEKKSHTLIYVHSLVAFSQTVYHELETAELLRYLLILDPQMPIFLEGSLSFRPWHSLVPPQPPANFRFPA